MLQCKKIEYDVFLMVNGGESYCDTVGHNDISFWQSHTIRVGRQKEEVRMVFAVGRHASA